MEVHYSSKTDDWATPQDLFDSLNRTFNFDLDPCASVENAKCGNFHTLVQDGLEQEWRGKVFMNPPYGRGIGAWIKKAYEHDDLVVCLLPARTDTKWWHDYCIKADTIIFMKGRLKFGGGN